MVQRENYGLIRIETLDKRLIDLEVVDTESFEIRQD